MSQRAKRAIVIVFGVSSALLMACSLLFPFDDFSSPSDAGSDAASDVDAGCATPLLLCGTECVDPRKDDNHCGACDIVCKGTTCGASMCKPFVGTSAGLVPAGIVFDGTYVYWAVAKSVTEASYVYRLNPADVAAGVDGSAPQLRSLGAVTVTHVVQARSGEIFYSLENRITAPDAGAQPAQLRYFRFDVDAGAKPLSQTLPGDIVSGVAVREVDAGTSLAWVSETPDGGDGKVTLHLGSLLGGIATEVDSGAVGFVYNGTTALPHVEALTAGPDPQLFFFASDLSTAWILERLDHGLEGDWSSANSKVLSQKPVHGLAYDGANLIWTVDNEIWQSSPNALSPAKLASVGANSEVAYAISGDENDTYVLSAPPTDRTKGRLWRRRRGGGGAITAVGNATIDGDGAVLVTDAWVFWVSAGELRFLAR